MKPLELLVGLFPANAYAAVSGIPFGGRPPTRLWLGGLIQIFFMATLWWTSISHRIIRTRSQ